MDFSGIGEYMKERYCIYKEKLFKNVEIREGKIELVSPIYQEGFSNYVDVIGRVHSDLFIKTVELAEVDSIYDEIINICYKGIYFDLFVPITPISVEDNKYVLFTSSEEIAQKFDFEKKEQFVFAKEICKEQIDSIKITQKPIKEFEKQGVKEIIISRNEIDTWLNLIK